MRARSAQPYGGMRLPPGGLVGTTLAAWGMGSSCTRRCGGRGRAAVSLTPFTASLPGAGLTGWTEDAGEWGDQQELEMPTATNQQATDCATGLRDAAIRFNHYAALAAELGLRIEIESVPFQVAGGGEAPLLTVRVFEPR